MEVRYWGKWNPNKELSTEEYTDELRDSIISSIRKNGYKFPGEYHQNGDCGCPYFDNDKCALYSFRGWGRIMSDAYDIDDYCIYAWFNPNLKEEYVYPNGDTQ